VALGVPGNVQRRVGDVAGHQFAVCVGHLASQRQGVPVESLHAVAQSLTFQLLAIRVVLESGTTFYFYLHCSGGSVVERLPREREVVGPPTRHTKDVIQMVPYASLLSALYLRIGLASFYSHTSFKQK